MMGSTLKALALTSVVLVAATVAVFAQTTPPAPAPALGSGAVSPMAACRADMQALCAGAKGDRGARMQCLVENKAKASAECQSAMAVIQDRLAQRGSKGDLKGEKRVRFAACKGDVASLCPEAIKGGERAQCLRQNEAKLSPECGVVIKQIKDARGQGAKQAKAACANDAQVLCATVDKGRGGMMRCLRDNAAKVSPSCSQALAALPGRKSRRMEPAASPGVVPGGGPSVAPAPVPNAVPNTVPSVPQETPGAGSVPKPQ